MAVLAAVIGFTHLLAGFDNPTLVRTVTTLLGRSYTSRQATYDLRRLKRKGLIVRLSGHHRYQLTPLGRRVAVLFTKVYGRVLAPGLAELDPRLPTDLANHSGLAQAWRQLDRRLNQFTTAALTAA
jgi:predicted MarR family transcription regulator